MKIKSVFIYSILACAVVVFGFFAIRKESGPQFGVIIDLSNPMEIEWPCEIAIVGDYGERGLRIPPGIGRGWAGEAGGRALYNFFIPEEGTYHIWAYSYWNDECSDAIFAQINDSGKAVIGNNPVHKQWHWVRGFAIDLARGTHTLDLSNHCDNIAVQKIMMLNSPLAQPTQAGMVFSDLFYDGFDGCTKGNFGNWRILSGDWSVGNTFIQKFTTENFLIGKSTDESLIVYESDIWENYIIYASMYLPENSHSGQVGICFGYNDLDNFYELQIKPSNDKFAIASIIKKHDQGNTLLLQESHISLELEKWHQITIRLQTDQIEIEIGGNRPIQVGVDEKVKGSIGFRLQGPITTYFDNIHVQNQESASGK